MSFKISPTLFIALWKIEMVNFERVILQNSFIFEKILALRNLKKFPHCYFVSKSTVVLQSFWPAQNIVTVSKLLKSSSMPHMIVYCSLIANYSNFFLSGISREFFLAKTENSHDSIICSNTKPITIDVTESRKWKQPRNRNTSCHAARTRIHTNARPRWRRIYQLDES